MRPRRLERAGSWLLRILTYAMAGGVFYVLGDIVVRGAPAIDWEFLTAEPRAGGIEGGIFPAIVGTLWLVAGTAIVALPLGMGAAIYFSEYAHNSRWSRWLRLGVITLAGIPSIVFGLFGLGLFVIFLGFGASVLAGSLTLAFMILPVVIVASEEALRGVPRSYREASLALGATQWQTVRQVVLPHALPGMLTGSILGIGRAAGETAPILFTVAAFYLPELPSSIFDQVMALPYHLYILATQHPDPAARPMQYGTALVLVALVVGVNAVAILWRARMRRRQRT